MIKIDKYANINILKDIHPTEKAVFSLSFLLFSIITKSFSISPIAFLVMSLIIVFAAKIKFSVYIKLLFLPFFFLLTSVCTILISIVHTPSEAISLHSVWNMTIGHWLIYISRPSLYQASQIIVTAIASISSMYFLILTTPLHQLIWLLHKIKVPTLFIDLVIISYRFIFVLLEKTHEIYLAQSSRLGYKNYRVSLISLGQLIVSLFIKSIKSAKELQIAIDSRGGEEALYDVGISHHYNRLHWIGIIFFIVVFLIITFYENVI